MPCISDTPDNVSRSSGAFDINKNVATIAGGVCIASGGALALGLGTAVAPLPVVGLTAVGGGLLVTGSFKEVKDFFTSGEDTSLKEDTYEAPEFASVEEDGYASVQEMSAHLDTVAPVNTDDDIVNTTAATVAVAAVI